MALEKRTRVMESMKDPRFFRDTMNAAAPDGASCAADRWQKFKKNSLPAVPWRGPEAGPS